MIASFIHHPLTRQGSSSATSESPNSDESPRFWICDGVPISSTDESESSETAAINAEVVGRAVRTREAAEGGPASASASGVASRAARAS